MQKQNINEHPNIQCETSRTDYKTHNPGGHMEQCDCIPVEKLPGRHCTSNFLSVYGQACPTEQGVHEALMAVA